MNWVTETREYIGNSLSKIPKELFEVSKEYAIELLCKELEKIPVPFVGTILSKLLNKASKPGNPGEPDLKEVLESLQRMSLSDDDLLRELTGIGEDINRLETIITSAKTEIEVLKKELTIPKLAIRDPDYKPRYPVFDNELVFSLLNIGGGSVKVHEINLYIERWEPEIKVNYTAPAAPPVFLRLKVQLSPSKDLYPLLQLNNEPYRRFGAYSEGAEDVCIQMSSETNARYYIRIRVPYMDHFSGQVGELLYPELNQPALEVSFPYAPGWNRNINPENMLERGAMLDEITSTFNKATMILEEYFQSGKNMSLKNLNSELCNIGFSMGCYYLPYVLNHFFHPVAQMIKNENQTDSVKTILNFAHASLLCFDDESNSFQYEQYAIDSLCDLFEKPEMKEMVRGFFAQPDRKLREKVLAKIFKSI